MKIRGANQTGDVPANYRCYKCHQPGHWIKNCPLGTNQEPIEIKKSTGIPRSFMVPVEGPLVPGAMMTPTGHYAVPAIDQYVASRNVVRDVNRYIMYNRYIQSSVHFLLSVKPTKKARRNGRHSRKIRNLWWKSQRYRKICYAISVRIF